MSTVEKLAMRARNPVEHDSPLGAAVAVIAALPGAAYVCDKEGWIVSCNAQAVQLWGRAPDLESRSERYCGSRRLYLPDGSALAHEDGPVAKALRTGAAATNADVLIERPDASRVAALVNVGLLRDAAGRIQGAIGSLQDISANKRLLEDVRQKNSDLEDLFENGAVALHIVSGEGIILRANKAELALLGYDAEEYIGRHIAEFHADSPVIGDILQRLSCGEKLYQYPARLRAKDGTVRHVLITSSSRFENGKFVNTRCFTTDVSRTHEAEAARRTSEERLAATYEAATLGIAEADSNGRLLRVNKGLCDIIGHPRERMLQMSFLDYTHPEDRAQDAALYARQVRGEFDRYTRRKRVIRPDGVVRYVDVSSSSVRDRAGNFCYGVRTTQDVTESRQIEERLRHSEQQMRDLLEALPVAIYTTDAHGRINFYNKASIAMAGRTPQLGEEWCVTWRLYTADGVPLPHSECPMAVALKENRPIRGVEAIAERPDGTLVPFVPYPTPLHGADGKLIGAINMLVDITERKDAENRKKVLIDELNHRVKNTLSTVQALARQTARHAGSLGDFVDTFEKRLMALARAHDLLTLHHWQDAPFERLVHDILLPLTGEMGNRIRIEGVALHVSARTALSITMVLNELATNAMKYGALSTPAGVLSICWVLRNEGGHEFLRLSWTEQGGPPVEAPKRRGFGSRLMERCIEGDLAGEFDLLFDPDGVRCRMGFPVSSRAAAAPGTRLAEPSIAASPAADS